LIDVVTIVDAPNPYASPSADRHPKIHRPAISGLRVLISILSALVVIAGAVHLWAFMVRGASQMGEGFLVLAVVMAASVICMWSLRALQSRSLLVVSISFLLLVVTWFFGSMFLIL